ncbi:FAD-binding oxidoreductase [Ekhidna sp. MALMAid0563]|uniref:FAD-binding oxidoreductase n=1 Tax=Ekhidna sp. MALMAid0563 TaxID=3143937 RepID=UPI0032DF26A1
MDHKVEITDIFSLTHDVKRIKTKKPDGYDFKPGQATEVAIDLPGFEDKKRPFTFTSLPEDEHLEFVIKSYRDHNGVTNAIDGLVVGNSLIIGDAWGAIEYKGRGTFIAGGAGITPFISILRDLNNKGSLTGNKLIFSNKTGKDVILEADLDEMLQDNFTSVLTREEVEGHKHGRVDMTFLRENVHDFSQHFYVCGPDKMVKEINEFLQKLGANADALIFEK